MKQSCTIPWTLSMRCVSINPNILSFTNPYRNPRDSSIRFLIQGIFVIILFMRLIVLYGAPATGKYTIGKILAERLGYKLFHNHLIIDLFKEILNERNDRTNVLDQEITLQILKEACNQNVEGVIYTFVYNPDKDRQFVTNLSQITNSETHFFELYCTQDTLLKRVTDESRKPFKKVHKKEHLEKFLKSGNYQSSIDLVTSIKIDSTHLTPEQTVGKILEDS